LNSNSGGGSGIPPGDSSWTEVARQALFLATVAENPWVKHAPTPRQTEFLLAADVEEVFYGGAAGGGKSDALLTAALQFAEEPEYNAILFRKTYRALALSGGLMDRAHEWLGTQARWNSEQKEFKFPSGATLSFGFMENDNDQYRYASTDYQFIGFDELTDFKEEQYLFMFSRLRRLAKSPVPMRVRGASNPVGPGREWVKRRFVSDPEGRLFVPATLEDNPFLDRESYRRALQKLPEALRNQLLHGDWRDLRGGLFSPDLWPLYQDLGDAYSVPKAGGGRQVFHKAQVITFVVVDWATSEKKTADPSCFGLFGLLPDGRLLVLEVIAERWNLERVVPELAKCCGRWKPSLVCAESNVFQAALANECRRHAEIPEVRRLSHEGRSKLQRALPAVTLGENGRILLPEKSAAWVGPYCSELAAFAGADDGRDDRVDVTAYASQQANSLRGPATRGGWDSGPCVLIPGYNPPFTS
jgi:predicted phage terminase large subunit-like protein